MSALSLRPEARVVGRFYLGTTACVRPPPRRRLSLCRSSKQEAADRALEDAGVGRRMASSMVRVFPLKEDVMLLQESLSSLTGVLSALQAGVAALLADAKDRKEDARVSREEAARVSREYATDRREDARVRREDAKAQQEHVSATAWWTSLLMFALAVLGSATVICSASSDSLVGQLFRHSWVSLRDGVVGGSHVNLLDEPPIAHQDPWATSLQMPHAWPRSSERMHGVVTHKS